MPADTEEGQTPMDIAEIKQLLETEVPQILRESPGFKDWLQDFVRRQSVSKESFDERFDRMMNELAADREEQRRRWEEQDRKWWEHNKEQKQWRAEQEKKWEEQNRRWEAQEQKWEEQNRRWNENQETLRAFTRKHEQSIGALGARWGLASEESFRAALKGILQGSFGVEVLNVTEFDDEGLVFGRPDQVELDVIIKNGTLILCELKASISKGDVFLFERKILYYEKRHQRTAHRRIIVSPMVDPKARASAEKLGMEVFSFAEDVSGLG
jgi:hypothetical protein